MATSAGATASDTKKRKDLASTQLKEFTAKQLQPDLNDSVIALQGMDNPSDTNPDEAWNDEFMDEMD